MDTQPLLTEKTLADWLGITPGCLAKWRITGEGPQFCRIGRRIGYRPEAVESWLDARVVTSTSQVAA